MFSHSLLLLPLATLAYFATAQTSDPTCESYGIDFQNGGSYFINTLSNASFTCATQFSGCTNDTAYIMLVDPNENNYECTNIPTQPDYTTEMSTCPILKNQMFSGNWEILVLGNNLDDPSFAYQREFYLDCGPQATVTVTPTVTYSQTITPSVNVTITSTLTSTVTKNPSKTIVVPASTYVVTVTPKPSTTTSWHVITRTYKYWTHTKVVDKVTVEPQCTVPPRQQKPDPQCKIVPKGLHWPHGIPGKAKRDTPLDSAAVRARFETLRAKNAKRNAAKEIKARDQFVKRSADQPTSTLTLLSPVVNSTTTFYAPTSTLTDLILTTKTKTTDLPPTTIHSGVKQTTTTLKASTYTVQSVTYKRVTTTRTLTATLTHTVTVTPSAQVTSCKKKGGHFGGGWQWYKN